MLSAYLSSPKTSTVVFMMLSKNESGGFKAQSANVGKSSYTRQTIKPRQNITETRGIVHRFVRNCTLEMLPKKSIRKYSVPNNDAVERESDDATKVRGLNLVRKGFKMMCIIYL